MSAVSVERALNDNADTGQDADTRSAMEKEVISNRQHLKTLLPLPHLHPPSLCPAPPPSDRAYLQAAAIFQQLRAEKPETRQLLRYDKKTDAPLPECGDKALQEQAYQLAFNTLRYQDLLENIIADSCFHTSQHICDDLLPLAMVMLFDFQDRKFLPYKRSAPEGRETLKLVRDLDSSLQKCKIKLAASLARYRVKQNLWSVSCFLSDSVRTKHHRAKCLPLYAWINTLKASVDEVCELLRGAGLREAENVADLTEAGFCRDPLCPDTLVFSHRLRQVLERSALTTTHLLNIQDRSVCVAVSVLQPVLFDKGDVLVAGSFSALTVAHVATVAAARSGRVLVCGGDHTPPQLEEMQELRARMEIKNVRVLSEAFCSLDEWHTAVQRLKVIIVLPRCSSSALNDPVATIHSEHGDWELLPDLSHGSVSKSKLLSLATQQARLLAHALIFPKVQTVVYCTRSEYPEENEQLVGRVLEKTHTHPKLLPFRVNGPIFPDESPTGDTTNSKFFRLEPCQLTNGCFIARLSRQADPTKVETVQDVLARAAAKGLLGNIIPEPSKNGKKGKGKKNQTTSSSKPPSPSGQEGLAEPEPENGRGSATPSKDGEERGDDRGEAAGEEVSGAGGAKKKRRKRKKHPKQTKSNSTGQKVQPTGRRKKPAAKKANPSHHRGQQMRSKPRRIPRLTLSLMSAAKPSSHLSPITAVAHKISGSPAVKSEPAPLSKKHPGPPPPSAPGSPHVAARRTVAPVAKQPRQVERPKNVVRKQEVTKTGDGILPPISPRSPSASRRRIHGSASQASGS
ncbi:putative methyltransferase NSUN7 [Menidia menidia]